MGYELTNDEMIGYAGGVVLAIALIPQLYKSITTWSTEDISYGWQAIYIAGLWLNLVYFILVDAVAAWVTLLAEMFVAHALLCLKLYLDGCKRRAPVDSDCNKTPTITTSSKNSVTSGLDIRRSIREMTVRNSITAYRRTSLTSEDIVSEVYRGFHFTVDATFTQVLPAEFGHTMMAAMLEAAKKYNVRVVQHMIEIFDGSESPPGFASAALIDESHMSAHCYTDQGMLAFDCFTCGADPEKTRLVTASVVDFLEKNLGAGARLDIGHMPRFPVRKKKGE